MPNSTFYGGVPVSKEFVDSVESRKLKADLIIWAEENAGLGNNSFEWAFGNGDNTRDGFGIPILQDCELIGMSTDATGSAVIEARKNNAAAGVSINRALGNNVEFPTPVEYLKGDVFNFRTLSNAGASNEGTRVAAYFRYKDN